MATTVINSFISPRSPLELTVKTDNLNEWSTEANQFKVSHYAGANYNYKIDWGDGTVENIIGSTSPVHTYPTPGTYSIKIWGIFAGINSAFVNDTLKLISIDNIDRRNNWTSLVQAFQNCNNLERIDADFIPTKGITNINFAFSRCYILQNIPWFDTSSVTNGSSSFMDCRVITSIPDFDFSNCTNFYGMFSECLLLSSMPNFDTSKGREFTFTWRANRELTSFPLLDFGEALTMTGTWQACWGLTTFPDIRPNKCNFFGYAWEQCPGLVTFPGGVFDDWTGSPNLGCFFRSWGLCPSLSSQSVENILVSIDISGRNAPGGTQQQSEITIDYNISSGALSQATLDAIDSLKAKGWHPRINNTYV